MSTPPQTKKAAYWVFAVLLLGLALGGVGGFALARHYSLLAGQVRHETAQERRERYRAQLKAELGLTDDQQKRVDEIVAALRAKYRAIEEQSGPQIDAARQQARNEIRAVLTPEQRPKFEDFLRRLDEDGKKRHRE
jgi:Spy/CpxP family protein refolding chaperone